VASSNRPNDTESESSSVADREEQEELVQSEQESVEGAEQEEPPAAARGGGGRGRGARGRRGRGHGAAPAAAAPVAAPGRGAGRGAAGAAKYTWVNVAQHVFTPRAEFQGKSVPELGAIFDGLLHDSQPYEFFARVDASCNYVSLVRTVYDLVQNPPLWLRSRRDRARGLRSFSSVARSLSV